MYPTKSIRKFVCDRLTEVAREILGAFESKVVDYEAEIIRQRRLLEKVFTPELKLHRADFQITQCKKELDVWEQQHKTTYILVDGVHIKDEQVEICIQHETPNPTEVQGTCASNLTPAYKENIGIEQSQPSSLEVGQNGTNEPDLSTKVVSSAPVDSAPNGIHQVPSHNPREPNKQGQIRCDDGRAVPTNDTEIRSDGNAIPAGRSEPTVIEELDEPSPNDICTSQSVSAAIVHQATSESLIYERDTSIKVTEAPLNAPGNTTSIKNPEPITKKSCRKTTTTNRSTDLTSNVGNDGENLLLTKQAVSNKTSAGCLDHLAGSAESPPEEGRDEDNAPSTQRIEILKERKSNKEPSNGSRASKPSERSTSEGKRKSSDGISTSDTNRNRKKAMATKIRSSDGSRASTTRSNKKVKLTEWTAHRTSGKSGAGEISSVSTRSLSKKDLNEEKTKMSVDTESAVDLTCYQESTTSNTTKGQAANLNAREEKTDSTLNCKSAEEGKSRKRITADSGSTKSEQNETSSANNSASSTETTRSKKPRGEKVGTETPKKSNGQTTKSARSDQLKDVKSKSGNVASSISKNLSVSPEPRPSGKRDMSSDGDENPYKCDHCGKVMSNFKNYKFHLKSHTIPKTFKCDICRTRFRESWDLKKHMVIHSTEKPFTCNICGNSFNRIYNLDLHKRVHTGEKPYKCGTCEKSFSALVNMKKHMRVHTGEKPYTCEDCGKEFSSSSSFKNHQRVHTGEKPFKCTECKKRFATATTLKNHFRTHTGEKPYTCGVCDKAFAYRTDMNRHMRLHTGEKPYECATCGEKFSTWSNRDKHKRKHTSGSENTKD